MGISFHPACDASWSYAGFDRFLCEIAALVGIDNSEDADWSNLTDPIAPLLNNAYDDTRGFSAAECRQIAPRLRELLAMRHGLDAYNLENGLELCKGLQAAADSGERLAFH